MHGRRFFECARLAGDAVGPAALELVDRFRETNHVATIDDFNRPSRHPRLVMAQPHRGYDSNFEITLLVAPKR